MADFDPPFAWDGERRVPTADEIQSGIGCGPFSLPMWNWLLWSLQSEIGHVITFNGLTPDNGDMEQLRKAIQAQIDASTGGGDPSAYLTLLQASSRLPIFPEVQNANGHFGVITPATGQVRIPSGVTFLHRGISPYTTAQTDLATDASKNYHLRWNKTDGFTLKDLASGGYNPGPVAETDVKFDSTYDDMLVARVITNSSNVPTITNLVNRDRVRSEVNTEGDGFITSTGTGDDGLNYTGSATYNLARTPSVIVTGSTWQASAPKLEGWANRQTAKVVTRYGASATFQSDYDRPLTGITIRGLAHFSIIL